MLSDFGFVGLFIIAAIAFSCLLVIIPVVLRFLKLVPHNPSPIKNAPFECGMETIGKTWVQFNIRYYFYAMIFLALDILAVFLYPWAANLRELGTSGLTGAVIFIVIILVAYLYAWQKKVLEWK